MSNSVLRLIRMSAIVLAIIAFDSPIWAGATTFDLIEVSPSVVMASHSHGANITCISTDDGLVFVDSGLNTELAARFRKMMEERFHRQTIALYLTHAHLDHFLGMGAFADVQVIAAEAARPLFEYQLAIEWNEKAVGAYAAVFPTFAEDVKTAAPFLPTVWVDDIHHLQADATTLKFQNTGGHSSGSSFVYFSPESVLIAGDLVQVDKYPYFGDRTTDLGRWIETLKLWNSMEVEKICPGHGGVVDQKYLPPIWEYFEALIAALSDLKNNELPIEEVVVHPSLPDGYWPDDQVEPRWWKMCIARAYQGL